MMVNWNYHQHPVEWANQSHITEHYQFENQFNYDQNGGPSTAGPQNYYPQDPQNALMVESIERKRKSTDTDDFDLQEPFDSVYDRNGIFANKKYAKQNHSEIEKRRRDKMNAFILELSSLIPMCGAINRKLDKLSVLRMAVQHLKNIHGSNDSDRESSKKHAFLSDEELKHLILQAAGGFLFVVDCNRGRLLFVSESVEKVLRHTRTDMTGRSIFDFLHQKDILKVKEQLLSSDLSPRERLIDAKTMLPVKTELPTRHSKLHSGARRQFFCRMKVGKQLPGISEPTTAAVVQNPSKNLQMDQGNEGESGNSEEDCGYSRQHSISELDHFSVINCTGYLKSLLPGQTELNEGDLDEVGLLSCLVAVGKIQNQQANESAENTKGALSAPLKFMWRLTVDGRFSYVDQRVPQIIGYLPQDLLGTSISEYYHQQDINHMTLLFKKVLMTSERLKSVPFRFMSKSGAYLYIESVLFSFVNPWTQTVEYVVSSNTLIKAPPLSGGVKRDVIDSSPKSHNSSDTKNMQDDPIQEFAKIGRKPAEEIQNITRMDTGVLSDCSKYLSPDDSNMEIENIKSEPTKEVGQQCALYDQSIPLASNDSSFDSSADSNIDSSVQSSKSLSPKSMTSSEATETLSLSSTDSKGNAAEDVYNQQSESHEYPAMDAIMCLLREEEEQHQEVSFGDLQW